MPNMYTPDGNQILFDKILADVPCSGDGTIRKSPVHAVQKWSNKTASGIGHLQFNIAKRGIELLKPGGVMVYSTCSLNPIENEGTVSRLLEHFEGEISLDEIDGFIPGLTARHGLETWKVQISGKFYDSVDQFINQNEKDLEARKKEKVKAKYKSLFPNPCLENRKSYQLHKCRRIVPHDNNSGGFFIARIRKRGVASKQKPPACTGEAELEIEHMTEKEIKEFAKIKIPEQIPYRKPKDPLLDEIAQYYGIKESSFMQSLVFRGTKMKRLYSLSKGATEVLCSLQKSKETQRAKRVNIVVAGTPVFGFSGRGCSYRILQESIHDTANLFLKRKVQCPMDLMMDILQLSTNNSWVGFEAIKEKDENVARQIATLELGSFILEGTCGSGQDRFVIPVAFHKFSQSIEIMVAKQHLKTILNKVKWSISKN